MSEITFSVGRRVVEEALTKALLEHPPYGRDEPPLLHAMLNEQTYTYVGIWGGGDKVIDEQGTVIGKMQLGDSYADLLGIKTVPRPQGEA